MNRLGRAKWNGRLLAEDRHAAGYITREMSDMVGINHATLTHYENSKSIPDIEIASMLADILGYEVTRYISWEWFG